MKIAGFLIITTFIAPGVFGQNNDDVFFDYPCDFSELTPNAFDPDVLFDSCRLKVSSAKPINVFNSSNIKSKSWRYDPDLGSPNRKCNQKGPGRGVGGIPGSDFENCEPLGNLLILQNPAVTDRPNDDARGGCIFFDFNNREGYCFPPAVTIHDFGLLDIEEGATLDIYTSGGQSYLDTFTIPANTVGDNGHWIASKSMEWNDFATTLPLPLFDMYMDVCFNGSGAVSFINYSKVIGDNYCGDDAF